MMITKFIDDYVKLLRPPPASPAWWCITIYYPNILLYFLQSLYLPRHRTLRYNMRVYDGMTRNDFIRGRFLVFLSKLGAIKKPRSYEDDPYNRAYFIGTIEDED